MDLAKGRQPEVDHKDNNGLNNQRENLRISTRAEQLANTRLRIDNTSSRKGVHWDSKNQKWAASITVSGKCKFLGRFSSLDEAALAHDNAAHKYFGEFYRVSVKLASMSVGD